MLNNFMLACVFTCTVIESANPVRNFKVKNRGMKELCKMLQVAWAKLERYPCLHDITRIFEHENSLVIVVRKFLSVRPRSRRFLSRLEIRPRPVKSGAQSA